MKIAKDDFSLLAIMIFSAGLFSLGSCKKSSNFAGKSIPLIGGFLSSDSVEPKALIAYWPFDNNSTEKIGGLLATSEGTDYGKGIRSLAYLGIFDDPWDYGLGDAPLFGVPVEVPLVSTNTAFNSLHSYSVSIWINVPDEVKTLNQVLFHIEGIHANLIELEFEQYSTSAGDKLKVHAGFTNPGGVAYKEITTEGILDSSINRWVHLVMTYNGGNSLFTLYQDAVPIALSSPWTHSAYTTSPIPIWTDASATVPMGNIDFASDIPQGITIGSFPPDSTSAGSFPRALDELRIFNIALTQKDVTGLYLNGLAGR